MTKRIIKDNKQNKPKSVPVTEKGTQSKTDQERLAQRKEAPLGLSKMNPSERPNIVEGKLPLWKVAVRLVGFSLVVFLNLSLLMSSVTYHHGVKPHAHQFNEPLLYGVLMFFNILILIPALFEVRWLKMSSEGLQLATLLWKSRLSWQDIVEFRHPAYLKVALLRTRRCFYILNRRDLTNYGLIEAGLLEKIK